MLAQLWLMLQFVLLTLGIAAGTQLAPSPVQLLATVLIGVIAVVPLLPWLARELARALGFTGSTPAVLHPRDHDDFVVRGVPGSRGTAMARAPSVVVAAFA